MKRETAKRAAHWWADRLRGESKLDNGDSSETGAMVWAMATMLQQAEKDNRAPEQIDAFEDALTDVLIENEPRIQFSGFGVDYHPDWILSKAAERAGVDLGMASLPWKTYMHIKGDSVRVAEGYGASAVEL